MLKGHPIEKATSRGEVRKVMEAAGFPYEATNPGQLASMIATTGEDHALVVATVDVNGKGGTMTFGGYYPPDEAPGVARTARRKRKVQVTSTMILNRPDTVL